MTTVLSETAFARLNILRRTAVPVLIRLMVLILLAGCGPRSAPVGGEIGDQVEAAMATGASSFAHADWDRLLGAGTVDGFVDYAFFQEHRAEFDGYVSRVAEAKLAALSRDHLMALLINAYNAYTIRSILDHPEVQSIREIDGAWDARTHRVGGFDLTLDMMEHGLLRPYFRDPRIHVAVNCAARSCPPLPAWAFDGDRLHQQLDERIRNLFADRKHLRIEGETLWISKLLDWYGGDFSQEGWSPRAETLAAFIAAHAPDPIRKFIEDQGGEPRIGFLDYDWSLNEVAISSAPTPGF